MKFLNIKNLDYFPLKYIKPKTNVTNYDDATETLFKKYEQKIKKIKNYK